MQTDFEEIEILGKTFSLPFFALSLIPETRSPTKLLSLSGYRKPADLKVEFREKPEYSLHRMSLEAPAATAHV